MTAPDPAAIKSGGLDQIKTKEERLNTLSLGADDQILIPLEPREEFGVVQARPPLPAGINAKAEGFFVRSASLFDVNVVSGPTTLSASPVLCLARGCRRLRSRAAGFGLARCYRLTF